MAKGRSQFVGSAGEYYVAYSLAVRQFHAATTMGNAPNVDLLVATPDGAHIMSLQVKTSRNAYRAKRYGHKLREWDVGAGAVNRCFDHLWYAFVDLQEDGSRWDPEVYLAPSHWVGSFVQADWARKMYMLREELWVDCRERWDRLEAVLSGDPDVMEWARAIPSAQEVWD